MRALSTAAAALALTSACAEVEPDVVMPVRLAVDYGSCGVDTAQAVEFSCGGSLSVWLVDDATNEEERSECLRLTPGSMSLDGLPEVLSGSSTFEAINSDSFFIALGVWTPSRGDFCRSWAAMGIENTQDGTGPLIYGSSQTVTAADGSREIYLPVHCALATAVPDVPTDPYDLCVEECQTKWDSCTETGDGCCPGECCTEDGSECSPDFCNEGGCQTLEMCIESCGQGGVSPEDPGTEIDPFC